MQDFINALKHMEEPILAFGQHEIKIFNKRVSPDEFVKEANLYLANIKSKSKIVKSAEDYIFLDYDIMNDEQRQNAEEVESIVL